MIVTLDTSFLILHYFSKQPDVLKKSKAVLHHCKLPGNAGILPTVVLSETYAVVRKNAGREVAEHRFRELISSGLRVVQLSLEMARESGVLRARHQEKIPWGDCLIAGTHIVEKADLVLSEDSHFKEIREIRASNLAEFKL